MCHTLPQNQPESAYQPEKWIALIINELSIKTHETTGNKPANPISSHSILAKAIEMKYKLNMTTKPQHLDLFCKPVARLPLKPVNLFQDDIDDTIQ